MFADDMDESHLAPPSVPHFADYLGTPEKVAAFAKQQRELGNVSPPPDKGPVVRVAGYTLQYSGKPKLVVGKDADYLTYNDPKIIGEPKHTKVP